MQSTADAVAKTKRKRKHSKASGEPSEVRGSVEKFATDPAFPRSVSGGCGSEMAVPYGAGWHRNSP